MYELNTFLWIIDIFVFIFSKGFNKKHVKDYRKV